MSLKSFHSRDVAALENERKQGPLECHPPVLTVMNKETTPGECPKALHEVPQPPAVLGWTSVFCEQQHQKREFSTSPEGGCIRYNDFYQLLLQKMEIGEANGLFSPFNEVLLLFLRSLELSLIYLKRKFGFFYSILEPPTWCWLLKRYPVQVGMWEGGD